MSQFQTNHAHGLSAAMVDSVLVARVTVNDQTLTVEAAKVNDALLTLHGTPRPDLRVSALIEFDVMSKVAFEALPEFQ